MLPGNGTDDFAKKIKATMEDSLARYCKAPWKFHEETNAFHMSK